MAIFSIAGSRRRGLEDCEFDAVVQSGSIVPSELFRIEEKGSVWEYIIMSIEDGPDGRTLLKCRTWLPEDGAFVGMVAETRAMNAAERRRYASLLEG